MKNQTLGELRMRGTAKLPHSGLHSSSLTRASYSSRYIACGSRYAPFVVPSRYTEQADPLGVSLL